MSEHEVGTEATAHEVLLVLNPHISVQPNAQNHVHQVAVDIVEALAAVKVSKRVLSAEVWCCAPPDTAEPCPVVLCVPG